MPLRGSPNRSLGKLIRLFNSRNIGPDGVNGDTDQRLKEIPGYIQATGGSTVDSPTHRYHVFTASGSLVVTALSGQPTVPSSMEYLVIAGGSAAGDGAFLWNVDPSGIGRSGTPGVINGYPIGVSTNVPSNLTKGSSSGVCSDVIFGDFSQVALGVWGNGLEIEIGTDSDDFSKALTSVRAITTIDVAVRQASAFAACLDVTT